MRFKALLAAWLAVIPCLTLQAADAWWPANDATKISRNGSWQWTAHRYAADSALVTEEDGAALEFSYTGRTLVLVLDTLTPPNHFGPPERGALEISVDGAKPQIIRPRAEAGEVVLARSASREMHRVRLVHRRDSDGGLGARVRGFRMGDEPSGDLGFSVSGEHQGALIDVRAILTREGATVRDVLVRNWLNGSCRLAAVPPGAGYQLELRAAGWRTRLIDGITIKPDAESALPAVYLEREFDVPVDDFKFPALGRPVVVQAAGSFRARFEANQAQIRTVRIVRQVGPATISRACTFEEDKAAAFYYHREGVVQLPPDTPPGVYDLEVSLSAKGGNSTVTSRRSVCVVDRMSANPVFFGFGHLDTWGQYQAEYVARLVAIANILSPDMVLVSNEANPAYASGALYGLAVPFVINFGNHRSPDPGPWFGEPVSIVDFGREFCVLNFGRAWDGTLVDADKLLEARAGTGVKVINAFESNAPVESFLDRHHIALIHYAHGPGPAVAKLGATPTLRVGKSNSESFRVIRFQDGKPVSYTYKNHATAPIPFARNGPAPIRLNYSPANDGTHREVVARFENDLEESFPHARATFVLPHGNYQVDTGRIERAVESDDHRFTVVSVRFDLRAKAKGAITIRPQ